MAITGGGETDVVQNLTSSCLDYREVEIEDDSVVYLDPPYFGTNSYAVNGGAFDYEAFYSWCESFKDRKSVKLFISEYNMP